MKITVKEWLEEGVIIHQKHTTRPVKDEHGNLRREYYNKTTGKREDRHIETTAEVFGQFVDQNGDVWDICEDDREIYVRFFKVEK